MTKKKLLARGVIFSYGAIGAQIIYSYASVPLALSYLTTAEFGMWSLIGTITGYMMLAEMGVVNSAMRHLLECTGTRDSEKYGRIFTASAIALSAISLLVLALGVLAAFVCGSFFPIPPELQETFFWVMLLKAGVTALSLATRMVGVPLYVHHRQDLAQINQIGLFVVYFVVLYLGLRAGLGIYALVANQIAGLVWSLGLNFISCLKLGYYPKRETLKLSTKEEFLSVWSLSKSVFVIQIGQLLLTSTPQILIARYLGLDISAAWAVYTRPFAILEQVVNKPFDVALPTIYEAYDRKDMKSVTSRWADISQVTLSVAVVAFTVAAANNTYFVDIWTHGRIHWSNSVQWCIAIYYYVNLVARLSYSSIGMDKKIGIERYTPLIQSVVTILIAIPAAQLFGVNGLLIAVSLPHIPGMIKIGVAYLAKLTGLSAQRIGWEGVCRPSLTLPLVGFLAWICSLVAPCFPGLVGLLASSTLGTASSFIIVLFFGISKITRARVLALICRNTQRVLPRFASNT